MIILIVYSSISFPWFLLYAYYVWTAYNNTQSEILA